MTGGWLPYHLRRNKSIDRAIFMEFLSKLNKASPISQYGYIGFGAIRMEDFKLIHSLFDIKDMTSIEMDPVICKRQEFNLPLSCINIVQATSDEFINDFYSEKNNIVWLDYTSPKGLGAQINEIMELLPKLREYDVLKVTLNANPFSLGKSRKGESLDRLLERRLETIKRRANVEFFPPECGPKMMDNHDLPIVLLKLLQLTSLKALEFSNNFFQPILSFVYQDSASQMLTLTGSILHKERVEQFIDNLDLRGWDFASLSWEDYQYIDMPDLTMKERLLFDSMMPCNDENKFLEEMEYQFDDTIEKSHNKIRCYLKYYRHYPYYSRVSI